MAAEVGLADVNQPGTGVSMGAVWGDYDNDGYEDVLSINGASRSSFTTTTANISRVSPSKPACPPGSTPTRRSGSTMMATASSISFIGGYYPEDVDLWHLKNTKMMPESFEYAKNGGRKYLFHNLGDGTFRRRLRAAGHRLAPLGAGGGGGRSARHRLSRISSRQRLRRIRAYFNEGGQAVSRSWQADRHRRAPKSGMSVAFGDVFNQGRSASTSPTSPRTAS